LIFNSALTDGSLGNAMLRGVCLASSAAVGKRMIRSPRIHEETNSETNLRTSCGEYNSVGEGDGGVSSFRLIFTLMIFLSSLPCSSLDIAVSQAHFAFPVSPKAPLVFKKQPIIGDFTIFFLYGCSGFNAVVTIFVFSVTFLVLTDIIVLLGCGASGVLGLRFG
jgi:hypothetical protein